MNGHRLLGWHLFKGLLCILLSSGTVFGQESNTSRGAVWQFRFDLFQMLLEQNGLRPIQNLPAALRSPERSVLVIFGREAISSLQLKSFIEKGGAVVIASDSSVMIRGYFSIYPGILETRSKADRYRDFDDCLRVRELSSDSELMRGVSELIVNRTGKIDRLLPDHGRWTTIAKLPASVSIGTVSGPPLIATLQPTSGDVSGRLMISGDHSFLTNGMIWHGDNAIFAVNLSRWLSGETRDQVYFSVDGFVQDSYLLGPLKDQLPMPDPNMPPPELTLSQKLQVANAMVKSLEDSNTLNEIIGRLAKNLPQNVYARTLLQVLSGLLVLIGLYYLFKRARKAIDVTNPQRPRSALELFRLAVPETGRQLDALRILARHFCIELTSSADPYIWHRELTRIAASPSVGLDRAQRECLSDIIALAENGQIGLMTPKRFQTLADNINALKAQIKNGIGNRGSRQ